MTPEENERMTRVGPGTPAGIWLRRYWMPALLSSELPQRDGAPVRVRLLGEDLIAFRDSEGLVGMVDAYCPHRRAPLFFGRNEECGIRCVYHGWKFDRHGDCVDMPSEPAGTTLQAKVKLNAYATFEGGGVVWTYMGPKEKMPPAPDFEWMRAPDTHRFVSKTFEDCNYLQGMEGGFDTAHSSFLHNESLGDSTTNLRYRDRAPQIEIENTPYGYFYTSTRNIGERGKYVRVNHYVAPFHQARGAVGGSMGYPKLDGHMWVPIDDEHTYVWNWMHMLDDKEQLTEDMREQWEIALGRGTKDYIPGTFRLKLNRTNDYMIDRDMQKTKTYTGIVGLNTQDYALQEGMGPVVDRSKEFLGTSDRAVINLRRRILEGIDKAGRGEDLAGTDTNTYRHVRGYDNVVPEGSTWQETFSDALNARW